VKTGPAAVLLLAVVVPWLAVVDAVEGPSPAAAFPAWLVVAVSEPE